MRSFEFVTPETDHPGFRLQPERRRAALVPGGLICILDDRSFKQSVHIFNLELKASRNHPVCGIAVRETQSAGL
jgi:hypothetical protein